MDERLEGQGSFNIMWSDDFLGNREGLVESGPFANWQINRPVEGIDRLWRGDASGSGFTLISDAMYDYVMDIPDFRGLTFNIDPLYELFHGFPHLWVGGVMGNLENTPFDPVFFMHHNFIDYMWDNQRAIVYDKYGKEGYVYPAIDDDEAFGVGGIVDAFAQDPVILESAEDSPHYPLRQMLPFEMLNGDSVDDIHMTTYYFEPRPTCNDTHLDCGSPYLFCIDGVYKCAPKLMAGANCASFPTSDVCYNGECIDGTCVSV